MYMWLVHVLHDLYMVENYMWEYCLVHWNFVSLNNLCIYICMYIDHCFSLSY